MLEIHYIDGETTSPGHPSLRGASLTDSNFVNKIINLHLNTNQFTGKRKSNWKLEWKLICNTKSKKFQQKPLVLEIYKSHWSPLKTTHFWFDVKMAQVKKSNSSCLSEEKWYFLLFVFIGLILMAPSGLIVYYKFCTPDRPGYRYQP